MNYREKLNKEIREYYKKYPWRKTFSVIKQRCTNPNNKSFKNYGDKGIKCLITEAELEYLWNRDKAWLLKKPSIDRKNSNKDYTLDNCGFIEKDENTAKDKRKIVLQYDLKGNFIREWKSQAEASRTLDISQGNIC